MLFLGISQNYIVHKRKNEPTRKYMDRGVFFFYQKNIFVLINFPHPNYVPDKAMAKLDK